MRGCLRVGVVLVLSAAIGCGNSSGGSQAQGAGVSSDQQSATAPQSAPATVKLLRGVISVPPRAGHACVVLKSGTVRCWGANRNGLADDPSKVGGQLGDGTLESRLNPVAVIGLTDVVGVGTSYAASCAVKRSGETLCWGSNLLGELGDGTQGNSRPSPTAVKALPPAREVVGGMAANFALLQDGTVRAWGVNATGQLGDGTKEAIRDTAVVVTGLSKVAAITVGIGHACALIEGGTVMCWGVNEAGQLGDGTQEERLVPVAVQGLSNVVSLSAGGYHTCAVLTDGSVKCWGDNSKGQSAGGSSASVYTSPQSIDGLSKVVQVAAGESHNCALLVDGTVQCWGNNEYGELGNGTTETSWTPVKTTGISNAVAVAAGWEYSCAVIRDGTVRCWGWNSGGQLGDGRTTEKQMVPTTVCASGQWNGAECSGGAPLADVLTRR